MLTTETWSRELELPYRGHAHLVCIEEKLGRSLELFDFKAVPVNWWIFPSETLREGWEEVPAAVIGRGHRRRLFKAQGRKDIVTMSLTHSGRWSLSYFSKALPGRYVGLHLQFVSAKRLSTNRVIDWAEALLALHPPLGG